MHGRKAGAFAANDLSSGTFYCWQPHRPVPFSCKGFGITGQLTCSCAVREGKVGSEPSSGCGTPAAGIQAGVVISGPFSAGGSRVGGSGVVEWDCQWWQSIGLQPVSSPN